MRKRPFLFLFLCLFMARAGQSQVVIKNTTAADIVMTKENIEFTIHVSNSPTVPDGAKINYAKGVPDNWTGGQNMEYTGGNYNYRYIIPAPQIKDYTYVKIDVRIAGFSYTNLFTVRGTNTVVNSPGNPYKIQIYEIDSIHPRIIHKPDSYDDEDDGALGKYAGIAGNGIPDEDEDGIDGDPYEFRDGLDTDDTGMPWGIIERTIQYAPVSIKAVFEDKPGAPLFDTDALAYLYYRRQGEMTWMRRTMRLVQGKVYATDLPGLEISASIEYFFAAVDSSSINPITGDEFYNISINDKDCFVYSSDGVDNDGDGRVDEEKYDSGYWYVPEGESDARDDDFDGVIDEDINSSGKVIGIGDGYCTVKRTRITNRKNNVIILNDTQLNNFIISSFPINPHKITVYPDTSYAKGFSGKMDDRGGTVKFPDSTVLVIEPGTFSEEVEIVISALRDIPDLSAAASLAYTEFNRKIEIRRKDGSSITSLNKPITVTFYRPLLSENVNTLCVYYYNGMEWIPLGGRRSSLSADQQIGYGNPMVFVMNAPGIFAIMKNPAVWQNVEKGNVTGLRCEPPVFSPNGNGKAETTSINFLISTLSDPKSIGDVPLYCEVPVNIEIRDLKGNRVRKLCQDYRIKFEWNYGSLISYQWDGRNDFGDIVAPGLYIVLLEVKYNYEWFRGTDDQNKIFRRTTAVAVVR